MYACNSQWSPGVILEKMMIACVAVVAVDVGFSI